MENASGSEVSEPKYKDLVNQNILLSDEKKKLEQELDLYKFRYNELREKLFGRSSEKRIYGDSGNVQQPLLELEEEKEFEIEEEYTEVESYKKRKRNSKKSFPEDLPVDEVVYEPSDSKCHECGEELKEFSRDERTEIEFKPARFFKRKIIKVNCSCPKCKKVVSGQTPNPVIPGSQMGASFFAHLITSRFCDHQPYYRQSQIYEREGVIIPDKTLSAYAMAIGRMLEPIAKKIKELLFQENYLQVDETRFEVLAKGKTHRGQLWVINNPLNSLSYYEYFDSRSQEAQDELLSGYKGIIQTDAYSTYNNFEGSKIGCLAHARRKFIKASKLAKKDANYILKLISKLYKIEKDLKKKQKEFKSKEDWYQERLKTRKKDSILILDKIKSYLIKIKDNYVVEGHPMYEAINYMYKRYDSFTYYTKDGRYQIDNNDIERVIRPIAIGRRNWLFTGSENGAKLSAVMMTVVQTCRQLKVNPQKYLEDVLPKLSSYETKSLDGLTPMEWQSSK